MDISLHADDGTRLAARRRGRGTPVVLVHGTAGGLDSWAPVAPYLEDSFELWTYARRGYAPSGGCARPKSFADDVSDLRAVAAAAGSAAVVGASYGAIVGLHAARAGGVGSLVLFEPPLFAAGASGAAGVVDEYRALVAAGDLAGANHLFAAEVARVPAPLLAALAAAPADPVPDDAVPADAAPDGAALAEAVGSLHDLEALAADPGDVERWRSIDARVLLLQGGESWEPIPSTMDALAAVLPAAERVVFPGHLHFATHTAPDLFADAVRRFLGA
ncbi:alpha/beta hydrolase [Cryptosporangium japonicum]|uniref:Alpha/beta fold hydrolase n=1 Tax=Cryptosporangium japonicum TaxID=80872 RepID=A0ABP3E825_9ACTN